MPLTAKGEKILSHLEEEYGAEKGKQVLYAGKNKGTFTGIDSAGNVDRRESASQLKMVVDQLGTAINDLATRFDAYCFRADADKGDFVMLPGKPLPSGKTSNKLRARVIRVLDDGRLEVKIVAPGLYEGGYETVSERDLA